MARSNQELKAIHAKQKFTGKFGTFTKSQLEKEIILTTNEILGANKLKGAKLLTVNTSNENVKADIAFDDTVNKKDISKLRTAGFNISNQKRFPKKVRADLKVDADKARKFLKAKKLTPLSLEKTGV